MQGVKVGVGLANSEGSKFRYVVADAQTPPTRSSARTGDYYKVNSGLGDFLAMVGAKNLAANSQFTLGSTNVGPSATRSRMPGQMRCQARCWKNTIFALIQTLHQNGAKLTAPVLSTGYGGELLTANAGEKASASRPS